MSQHLFKMFLLALLAVSIETALGFPTIFNHRTRLFHNQPQQSKSQSASVPSSEQQSVQKQQQQQQFLPPRPEQLMLAANSFAPIGLYQGDLLRVNAQPTNVRQQMMQPHPQVAIIAESNEQQPIFGAAHPFAANLYPSSQHDIQHSYHHQIPMAALTDYREHQQLDASQSDEEAVRGFQRMQPSQSEVVDKIERHIGQQIEHSLNAPIPGETEAAASGYQRPAGSSAPAEQKPNEKEAAASGEEAEEAPAHEAVAEERSHEPEPKKAEESGHEHEHEHPPEAFEVHHKKGGKSFQYFHQGHHHP